MKYLDTNTYFYETATETPEEKWQAITVNIKNDDNLCDMQNDDCSGHIFYTDSEWRITHWCLTHWQLNVTNGIFTEVK